ncbi:MAG: hypothetical protein PHV71_03085 [Eubacteriales bacterium]|nr:hypothetical protein [Eubacteriales bacterium]MDD3198943.1 hypothetical protein [Eubacteriales bacterium]MDD4121477.1 hypothetical protein [Eubacteriales bacterium]MDD4629571.1 hypothetical protein [Eubacteriales bacterium]
MSEFPDVLGIELKNAEALLEAEGLDFIIIETRPPRRELTEGTLRVIRTQKQNDRVVLTVCRI